MAKALAKALAKAPCKRTLRGNLSEVPLNRAKDVCMLRNSQDLKGPNKALKGFIEAPKYFKELAMALTRLLGPYQSP